MQSHLISFTDFQLSSHYEKRFISVAFMYITLMAIETIIVLLSGYLYNSVFNINPGSAPILALISMKIVSYIVILLAGNYKNMKKGANIPNSLWLSIFFIPLGSLYVMVVLIGESSLNTYRITISIAILFAINIIVFYIYNVLSKLFEDRVDKIVLKEQNKYYQKQLKIMDNNNKNTRAFNHDLGNHLSVIRGYIQLGASERAYNYIDKLAQKDYTIKEISNCGNIDIDTILNYTLYEATEKNISFSLEINVPANINISSFDIVVILGNLLDNAIEAASKVKDDDKKIDIIIKHETNILFIHIKNTFNGAISYEKNNIITSKKDRKNHGIGLNNIQNILKKYNGILEIDHNDKEFCVNVKMYTQ